MAANRIYSVEDIQLQGWEKPIRIFPLVIKKFRALGEIIDKLSTPVDDLNEEDKEKTFLDVLLEATAFAMQTYEPKLSDPDVLADYVDMATMEHILDVAAGIKINDPNPQAAKPQETS